MVFWVDGSLELLGRRDWVVCDYIGVIITMTA